MKMSIIRHMIEYKHGTHVKYRDTWSHTLEISKIKNYTDDVEYLTVVDVIHFDNRIDPENIVQILTEDENLMIKMAELL